MNINYGYKNNRLCVLSIEQHGWMTSFFFYTEEANERDVSPLYSSDRTDVGEAIHEAWVAFKTSTVSYTTALGTILDTIYIG